MKYLSFDFLPYCNLTTTMVQYLGTTTIPLSCTISYHEHSTFSIIHDPSLAQSHNIHIIWLMLNTHQSQISSIVLQHYTCYLMQISNVELSTVQLLISTPESLTCYLLIFLSISRNKLLYYTTSNKWHSDLLYKNISILPISVLQHFIHLIVGKSVVTYANIRVNSHSVVCDQQRKITMY